LRRYCQPAGEWIFPGRREQKPNLAAYHQLSLQIALADKKSTATIHRITWQKCVFLGKRAFGRLALRLLKDVLLRVLL
jgi:hypothetical protein